MYKRQIKIPVKTAQTEITTKKKYMDFNDAKTEYVPDFTTMTNDEFFEFLKNSTLCKAKANNAKNTAITNTQKNAYWDLEGLDFNFSSEKPEKNEIKKWIFLKFALCVFVFLAMLVIGYYI